MYSPRNLPTRLSPEQKYQFDTFGYLILRNVLPPEFINSLNQLFDDNKHKFKQRKANLLNGKEKSYQGTGRIDAAGLFSWPNSNPFRELMCHPAVVPTLTQLCGEGYRLDHLPVAFKHPPGSEGFDLHGGTYSKSGGYFHDLAYGCHNGEMSCNLLAMSVALSDTVSGEGGFVAIPGSHKANFPIPQAIESLETEEYKSMLMNPTIRKGDVLFFTEALVHGAIPSSSPHERRVVLYRFSPPTMCYGRGIYHLEPEVLNSMTEAQKAVLQPPFHCRYDRDQVLFKEGADEVEVGVPNPRAQEKKDFDKEISGEYYAL